MRAARSGLIRWAASWADQRAEKLGRRPWSRTREALDPCWSCPDVHAVDRKLRRKRVRHQRIVRVVMKAKGLPASPSNRDE